MLKLYIPLALLLAAACGKRGAPQYRSDAVTRGPIAETVNATGDVSAIVTVNVGSQVSGIIDRLYVDFNSKVKKGDLLAILDLRLFQAQLEKANAGLASARANVERAQATYADSVRIAKRQEDLRTQGLVSQADVDTALSLRDGNAAALSSARASVLQAKADRDLAATNLAFARITSPIDGVVVSRNVDVGQTVAAAFQAPTLFLIANDLTKMQILANIDEADVGKVREGLDAKFTVDAYPGETFTGTIREVRQAPTTIQNVVTYAAVIDAPNPDRKLRQGMTASVTVTAARREDALRLPNAALRWRPDDATAPPVPAPPAPAPPTGRPVAAAAGTSPDRTLARSGPKVERPARPEGAGSAQGPGRSARVYKIGPDGQPVGVQVRIGLSDGKQSEVLDGLAEGDRVIIGGADSAAPAGARPQGGARRGPF